MTYHDFSTLFDAALETPRDEFVNDWALSELFAPGLDDIGPDDEISDPSENVPMLEDLWDAANRSIREIRDATGLTQVRFADRLCVPRRTVEGWEYVNKCPAYTRLMIQELLGIYTRPEIVEAN